MATKLNGVASKAVAIFLLALPHASASRGARLVACRELPPGTGARVGPQRSWGASWGFVSGAGFVSGGWGMGQPWKSGQPR
ncbi:hypothetical protein KH5H1_77380 [Corallococcus caeni]|nr:hypothetical protein KH5H1_77380 [Corallococcus sp. KH5-1]